MVQRKYFKGKTTGSRSHKGRPPAIRSRNKYNRQHGGDTGRYVMSNAFFGKGTQGYSDTSGFPTGSKQLAVSNGTIHQSGKFAGANLYPQEAGNSCGCSKFNYSSKSVSGNANANHHRKTHRRNSRGKSKKRSTKRKN